MHKGLCGGPAELQEGSGNTFVWTSLWWSCSPLCRPCPALPLGTLGVWVWRPSPRPSPDGQMGKPRLQAAPAPTAQTWL